MKAFKIPLTIEWYKLFRFAKEGDVFKVGEKEMPIGLITPTEVHIYTNHIEWVQEWIIDENQGQWITHE